MVNDGDPLIIKLNRKVADGQLKTMELSAPAMKSSKTENHVLELVDANEEQLRVRKARFNLGCAEVKLVSRSHRSQICVLAIVSIFDFWC